jgi:hypothetical protein
MLVHWTGLHHRVRLHPEVSFSLRRALGLVAGVVAISTVAGAESSSRAAGETCLRATASELRWVHSGEWEGRRLVLGDIGVGALAVLDLDGLRWSRVSHPGEGPLEFNKPIVFLSPGPGIVVSPNPERLVWLNESLQPQSGFDFSRDLPTDLDGFTDALVLGRREILGIGWQEARPGGETEPWVGLVHLALDPTPRLVRILPFEMASTELLYYSNVMSRFGTVIGNRFYWLVMDAVPHVLEIDQGVAKRLDLVPAAWRKTPKLASGGPGALRANAAANEKLPFLSGLYSQGKELFLFHHEPGTPGPTWRLVAVDPAKPGSPRFLTLPSRATWVTVIPGPDYWAVLEQGPVLAPATQTTTSVLLVPAAWFSTPDSPLTRPDAALACVSRSGSP